MTLSGKFKSCSYLLVLGLLTAALASCAAPPAQESEPRESPPAQVAVPPTAPASSESKTPQETSKLPKGVQELQEKLQPGGAKAPAVKKPDEETLKKEAEVFVKKWLEVLQKGEVGEAEEFAVSSNVLQGAMNPGYREILEGTVLSQNHLLMERLATLLKGKEIQHTWQPGSLTETPARHVFKQALPSLSSGVLQVDASGIVAEIHLDQLVYIDGQWKIFRMSVP